MRAPKDAPGKAPDEATRDAVGRFATPQPGDPPRSDSAEKPDGGKASSDAEGKKPTETVPKGQYLERLDRERKRYGALQSDHDRRGVDLAKAQAAVSLLESELAEYRRLAQAGQPVDPRDMQLRQHALIERARAEKDRVERGESERVAKAAAEAQAKADEDAAAQAMDAEINDALRSHAMASYDEVINAMIREGGKRSAVEVAREFHERRAAGWQRAAPPPAPAPPVPQTSRASSNGPSGASFGRHDHDAIVASLKAHAQMRGRN